MIVHLAYIAAIDCSWRFNPLKLRPERTQRFDHRLDFTYTSSCAGSRCNRYSFRNDEGVLDESAVRVVRVGRHHDHFNSARRQRAAVRGMLLERLAKIRAG